MKAKAVPRHFLSPIALALCASFSTLAQTAPDAGQASRESQQKTLPSLPKAVAPLQVEGVSPVKKGLGSDVRIAVSAIRVSGSSVFAASELEAMVADLAGGERTLGELEQGARRITAWYRDHGYVIARAYLPAQDIKDGVVTIAVLEGRVGETRITNQSRLSDASVNGYLDIPSGEVLQAAPVDRALMLLNETPGIASTRATLIPGSSVGTSDLIVEIDPAAAYLASVELDNYGNRYTGEYRLGASLALNSPLKIGDQLSLRLLASDLDLTYARLAYQLPVGSSGLRLGAAYAETRYSLGKDFASLNAHGKATSSSLFAIYPLVRSQARSLTGNLTWEEKKLSDFTDTPVSASEKRVELLNVGLAGSQLDGLGGGGITLMDLSLVSGQLSMDASSQAIDSASAKSEGQFTRLAYTLNRLQRLTDADTLSVLFSGQEASKNLNSSEKFSLGGATGVRAYPQGEGIGDQGWLVNLELRHNFTGTVQGVVFYDAGSVKISHHAFAAGANSRELSGAGFGANASVAGVQLKTFLAWRTSGGQPTSEPASVNNNPRLWFQLSLSL